MNKAVIGIVETRAQAEAVVETLRGTQHVRVSDISVLLPDTQGTKDFAHEHHTKAPEGAAAGAGAGGVLGGTLGLLAGIGDLLGISDAGRAISMFDALGDAEVEDARAWLTTDPHYRGAVAAIEER